jgi:membrane protein required for colicin V production
MVMTTVDIVVVVGLFFFAFKGYTNGLVHELLSLAAMGAGLVAAFRWTPRLVPRLAEAVPGPAFVDTGVAFLILFALVLATGRYAATMIQRVWVQAGSSPANRIAGMSFGIFKGAIVLGCTVLAMRAFVTDAYAAREELPGGVAGRVIEINSKVGDSYIAARLADLTSGIFSALMDTAETQVRSLAASEDFDEDGP